MAMAQTRKPRTQVERLSPQVRISELRAQLARRELPQWRLAADLGINPARFSAFLRGKAPAPHDLADRIERELGLKRGTLAA
jgi:plasmid maintenance system antidote protein VapI